MSETFQTSMEWIIFIFFIVWVAVCAANVLYGLWLLLSAKAEDAYVKCGLHIAVGGVCGCFGMIVVVTVMKNMGF
jgi:succinate dehydrogenase/fumarate reductase cytochrome b subunit